MGGRREEGEMKKRRREREKVGRFGGGEKLSGHCESSTSHSFPSPSFFSLLSFAYQFLPRIFHIFLSSTFSSRSILPYSKLALSSPLLFWFDSLSPIFFSRTWLRAPHPHGPSIRHSFRTKAVAPL